MSATIHYLPVRPTMRLIPGRIGYTPDSWIERGCCDEDELSEDEADALLDAQADAALEARWDREHEGDSAA